MGIDLARRLIDHIPTLSPRQADAAPCDPGQVLHAKLARRPDGSPEAIEAPLIPLLDTTLLTNAPRCAEP